MMLNKISLKLCRLCAKEKHDEGTNLFKDKIKGAVLLSIINKYFSKEVINILPSDKFSKFVCNDCEQKIYLFDEFCLMVANVQKQLTAPALEINFAEDMLRHLKENEIIEKISLPPYNDRKRKSICDVCSKSFRCQAHLERHKRIHTGVRPFVCDICSMSFNQREILTKHKERHEGKKEYQCANCQQSFRYKVSLQSHLVTFHADVDSNSSSILNVNCNSVLDTSPTCTDCGKIFATNYKLRRHARYHSGEKPYSCPYCSRNFSQTGNLKLHQLKCHQMNLESSLNNSVNGNQQRHLNVDDNCGIQQQQQQQQQEHQLNNFQSMVYITESEIQKTINETINSTTDQGVSYLNKSFESPMYIDEEIETMLDQDLEQLDNVKYSNSDQEKVSRCLKQPETPELLHSLLYDG